MKIKTGFVTNSSSTSYIMFIPNSFQISDKDILFITSESGYMKFDIEELTDQKKIEYIKHIQSGINNLKNGKTLYQCDTDYDVYYIIKLICEANEFIIDSIDSGSGDGKLIGITKDKIEKLIMKYADPLKTITVQINESQK